MKLLIMAGQWDRIRNATRLFQNCALQIAVDLTQMTWEDKGIADLGAFQTLPWEITEDLLAMKAIAEKATGRRRPTPKEIFEDLCTSNKNTSACPWDIATKTRWIIQYYPEMAIDWLHQASKIPFSPTDPEMLGFLYEYRTGFKFVDGSPHRSEKVILVKNPEKKRQAIYYTPEDVVDFILRHALDPLLNQIQQLNGAGAAEKTFEKFTQLAILDPACGGGAFLLAAWRKLINFYETHFGSIQDPSIAHPILYGVDIDPLATKIATFVLWLATPFSHTLASAYKVVQGNALWPETVQADLSLDLPENNQVENIPKFSFSTTFPDVFNSGRRGFDCVVGNPPYADIPPTWSLEFLSNRFCSVHSKDLYPLFLEQMVYLSQPDAGRGGLIVPLSLTFSKAFRVTREFILASGRRWQISSYHIRPSGIFPGVSQRTSIALVSPSPTGETCIETTCVQRWFTEQRGQLFSNLHYADVTPCVREIQAQRRPIGFPSVGDPVLSNLLLKLLQRREILGNSLGTPVKCDSQPPVLYYFTMAYQWLTISAQLPETSPTCGPISLSSLIPLPFASDETRWVAIALLASSLGFWWWQVFGDLFHVTRTILTQFPVDPAAIPATTLSQLGVLARDLQRAIDQNVTFFTKKGVTNANFDLTQCFTEITRIDSVLWDYLAITQEEVDALYANYFETTGKTIKSTP